MQLDPSAVAAGVRLIALGAVGSTNTEARLHIRNGECGPLWITAETQTEGRGRMDRSWVSPPGNLYASIILTDPAPAGRAPELSFVAALALRDAVIAVGPMLTPALKFKWPNDLLLDGGKCAGILIEGEMMADKSVAVVIGIGVNCVSHPETTPDRPATDLAAHHAPVTVGDLFTALSTSMAWRLAQWDRGANFGVMLRDWLAAARGLGEAITVKNGTGEKRGRFAGLDPSGRLMLELPGGGIEKISAGDVFPLERSVSG
jgi:BirA family transcriptional regulator, biotin operon repressor / biotin---[acetyl-CoA-carboxylase] ligase